MKREEFEKLLPGDRIYTNQLFIDAFPNEMKRIRLRKKLRGTVVSIVAEGDGFGCINVIFNRHYTPYKYHYKYWELCRQTRSRIYGVCSEKPTVDPTLDPTPGVE